MALLLALPSLSMAPLKITASTCDASSAWTVSAPATVDPKTPSFAFSVLAPAGFTPPPDLQWVATGSLGLPHHPLGVFKINASGEACGAQAFDIYDGILGRVNLTFPTGDIPHPPQCIWPAAANSILGHVSVFTPIPALPPLVSTGFTLEWTLRSTRSLSFGANITCIKLELSQPPTSGADKSQDTCGVTTTPNLPQYPPDASTVIPTVQVDLDEPAEQRWVKALAPRKAEIARLVYAVIDQLPFSRINSTVIRLLLAAGAEKEMARFPPDYAAEIRGVAAATGVPLGFIFVLNVAYELIGLCTSIVAQDAAGNVWHGRNLDFGIFMGTDPQHHTWALTQPLRDALVNVEFRRGGRPLFNATTYAGFVGVHSGMRSGAFSLTIDTRYDDSVDAGLIEFLLGKSGGREFIAFATRRALETNATYAAALDALTMYRPMGPGYIILGGANSGEGAVITKQFSGKDAKPPTKDVWKLSEVLANGSFYLAQTNYDRTGPPPAFDDRRYPVQNCLDDGGQASVTKAGLFQIMSANPTRNALTTFTTLMSAGLGVFEAYTQRCDPSPHCAPF